MREPEAEARLRLSEGFNNARYAGFTVDPTGLNKIMDNYHRVAFTAAQSIILQYYANSNQPNPRLDYQERTKPNPLARTIDRVTQSWSR